MTSISLPSFAKINLGLSILHKRNDGFHELETILQQINLKDEIQISLSDSGGVSLTCNQTSIPTGKSNLCCRAVSLFKKYTGIQFGVDIKLIKNIPWGAGLGGGSSNAAVTLLALNKLCETNFKIDKLKEMSAQLGSDIPFFIEGGTAFAYGRGEKLKIAINNCKYNHVLIVFPNVQISTKWAYTNLNLNLTNKEKSGILSSFKDRGAVNLDIFEALKNDFEDVVFLKYPVLGEIKTQLQESNAVLASLSGSGSALFGVFKTNSDVLEAHSLFEKKFRTFVTGFENWGYHQVNNLILT